MLVQQENTQCCLTSPLLSSASQSAGRDTTAGTIDYHCQHSSTNPHRPSSRRLDRRAQGPLSLERVFRPAIAKVNLPLAAARAQDPWIVRTARPSPQTTSDPRRREVLSPPPTLLPASRHATVNGYPDIILSTTTAPLRRSSPLRPRLSRARSPLDAHSLSLRAVAAVAHCRAVTRPNPIRASPTPPGAHLVLSAVSNPLRKPATTPILHTRRLLWSAIHRVRCS